MTAKAGRSKVACMHDMLCSLGKAKLMMTQVMPMAALQQPADAYNTALTIDNCIGEQLQG